MVDAEGLHTPPPEGVGRRVGRIFGGVGRVVSGEWLVDKFIPYPRTDEERRRFAHSELKVKRSILKTLISGGQIYGFYLLSKGTNWLYRHVYHGKEINIGPMKNEAAVRISAKTVEWSAVLGDAKDLKAVGYVMASVGASRNAEGRMIDVNDVSTWRGSSFLEEAEGLANLTNALRSNDGRTSLRAEAVTYAGKTNINLVPEVDKFDAWADGKGISSVGWSEIQQYYIDKFGESNIITKSVGLWRNIVEKLEKKDGRDLKKLINDYNREFNPRTAPVSEREVTEIVGTALKEQATQDMLLATGLYPHVDEVVFDEIARAFPQGISQAELLEAMPQIMPGVVSKPYHGVDSVVLAAVCMGVVVQHYGEQRVVPWVEQRVGEIGGRFKGFVKAIGDLKFADDVLKGKERDII